MEYLQRAWAWLNGKKRIIGLAVLFIAGGLKAIDVISQEVYEALMVFGGAVSAVGVGHALRKMFAK